MDLICEIYNGASVMQTVGGLLHVFQHPCFTHSVQMAIIEVPYQRHDTEGEAVQQFDED